MKLFKIIQMSHATSGPHNTKTPSLEETRHARLAGKLASCFGSWKKRIEG